jgi:hypothetical protein
MSVHGSLNPPLPAMSMAQELESAGRAQAGPGKESAIANLGANQKSV